MIGLSRKKNMHKFIAWVTLAVFSLQPVGAAAQAVADPNAPSQNRPTVASAQNGTPVVQIATPSAAGVSRNLYQQFDIASQGLILNNSYQLSKTQLAGYIQGNPNLAGGAARLILNEVTGSNISNLRGYLEVAGQRADVIIANRNGIVGNGFGFINTNRGVLTTGVPVFGGSGSLDAFRVTGGEISVQGDGINATGADRVDLISRAVSVNAGIWAKELNVVTGSNQVEYNTLNTQAIAGEGAQPQVALDVSALGGMYANKIKLVGTERGVGVNSQGAISATSGDLMLTNEGKITLSGQTNATGNLTINSTDTLTNQGTTYAQGNTSVTGSTVTNSGVLAAGQNTQITAQTIDSTGTLAAGLRSDGTIGTSGDLSLAASGAVSATGKNIAAGNLTETGAAIDHSGATTYAGNAANITATSGDINHTGATLQAGGALTMSAAGTIKNDKSTTGTAGQMTAGNIAITAGDISNQGGSILQTGAGATKLTTANTINNNAGTIATNGLDFSLTATNIVNDQGKIEQAGSGALTVQTTQDFINCNGSLASNGQVGIQAKQVNNTQGIIYAQKQLNVNADTLTNTKGNMVSGDAMALTSQGSINNQQGLIQSDKGLQLNAQSLDNQSGNVLNVTTGETKLEAMQALNNSAGKIGSNSNVAVTAQNLTNAGEITALGELDVTTGQGLNNTDGKLQANQAMKLNTGTSGMNNTRGTVTTGDSLSLAAETVDNTSGTMAANTDVNLTTKRLDGNEGKVTAGRDVTFVSTGDFTQGAGSQVKANGNVRVDVIGMVTNQGSITVVGDTTLKAAKITNGTTGTVAAKNTLTVSATDEVNNSGRMDGNTVKVDSKAVNNTGTVTAGSLTVNADTVTNAGDAAMLASTNDTTINVKDKLENKDGATIYSSGNILIAGSDKRDTSGQAMDKANSVLNQSATIEADGDIGIYAKDITNKRRVSEVGQKVVSDVTYSTLVDKWIVCVYGAGKGSVDYVDELYKLLDRDTAIFLGVRRVKSQSPVFHFEYDLDYWLLGQTVTETNFIQDSPEGKIRSGRHILLRADTVNNSNSVVMATGTLDSKGTVNNTSQGRVRTTTRHVADGYMVSNAADGGNKYYAANDPRDETTYEQLPDTTSIFGGGQQVIINGPNVNNITKNPENVTGGISSTLISLKQTSAGAKTVLGTNSALTTLPSNKLYTIHTEPSSHYLVETDPRFANYGTFITSDYMLNQLNLDPSKTTKQIGDGFYQQKLIREQLTQLTGRQFLNNGSSTQDEYKTLMNNGVAYAKQFNLQVGVALTAEQMAQLTSNMVWMVEQEVQGQKVLVPVVYLAAGKNSSLRDNGAIITADNVQITADQDIVNQNGKISGGQVNLVAGQDIKNETTTYVAKTGNNQEYGNDIRTIAGQAAEISATSNLTMNAGRDVTITGGRVSAEKDLTLDAGRNLNVGTAVTTDKTTAKKYLYDSATNIASSIKAGNNLSMTIQQDANLSGVQVEAGKDVTLTSSHGNININSVKESVNRETGFWGTNFYQKETTSNVVSSIKAGNNVTLTSQQNINLSGTQVNAGQDLSLKSVSGNIAITAVKDETLEDQKVGSSSHWKRTRTDDETVIGSSLQAGGNITVSAVNPSNGTTANPTSGNVTLTGSTIHSDTGDVTIKADNNVTVTAVTEKHESLVQKHTEDSGFFSSTTTDTRDYSLTNAVKGSTISGDTVSVTSGKDLTVKGSNVVATNDVNLKAGNDVTITSAQETGADEHYKKVEKSGLFSGGGLGFTIGSQSTTTNLNEHVKDEIGSTVGSIAGNVTITAGNNVKSEGTTVASGKDTTITGKNVSIDNTINTYDSQYKYEFKQSGLTVSLGGGAVDAGIDLAGSLNRAGDVQDNRLKALYINKAKDDLKAIGKDLKQYPNGGVSINVSIGSTKITSEQTAHVETVNMSNVTAGGNVTIKATEGDVNLKATNINATDVTIDAKKDINIESAQNKQQTNTNTNSSSSSIGASFGLSGSFGGFTGGTGSNKDKENEDINTHTESIINAGGTTTLKSGNDTNISGSQVKGEKVAADVGGNLNIASKQDTDNYTAKNQSSGISFETGNHGGTNGSTNTGKTNSNYSSVTEQAGIYAGKDGFDINVGKNTDLKGAVISSEATPDKNRLSTDTLTYSDIKNKAEYSASSSGFGVGISKDGKITGGSTPSMPVNGSADSTTKSAISPGTITVRSGNADISKLSRNTDQALNALGKIFDKETVKEKQELVNLFSQEANKAIGDLAYSMWKNAKTQEERDKWAEGGEYKALLHAVAAGITSSMAGEGFASGAFGDGISQLAQKQLTNITDKNLRLLVSAAIGAAAAKVVGGNAMAGASAAYNGVKYNDYIHHPTTPGAIVYSDGKPPNNEGRGYYKVDSNGDEEYLPNGVKPGDIFWEADGKYQDGQQMGNEWIVGDDGQPIAFQWVATQLPVGDSTPLQSYVTVYRAVNQETKKDVIVNGGTPMRDDTGRIYNQAVSDYENSTFAIQFAASFVNPGSRILSESNLRHIGKHIPDEFMKQVPYLSDEVLASKLSNTSFFNPSWSNEKIVAATEEAYNALRSKGLTGLQSYDVSGETIKVFIKPDGTFDTAYGLHKLTAEFFGR